MMTPIRRNNLLTLQVPAGEVDVEELVRVLDPLNITPTLENRFGLVVDEIKELVMNHGVSYVWRLVLRQEAVLPQTRVVAPLVQVLKELVAKLAPSRDFVIVDRFFLPKLHPPDYVELSRKLKSRPSP